MPRSLVVRDHMTTDVVTLNPEMDINRAVHFLIDHDISGAPVLDGHGSLVGILTERDALRLMAEQVSLTTPVSDVMSRPPVTISTEATVADVIRRMSEAGYRHLPIVNASGQPTGVVAVHGIVHYLVDHFPETVYNLPPDPNASPREREGA